MAASPLGRDSLVLCAGTIPRAAFRERVDAARAGGFAGISLRLGDYTRARDAGMSDADLRRLLSDEDIAVAEIEALTAWRPGAPRGRHTRGEDEMFAIAAALGARSVTVIEGAGPPLAIGEAAEAFAALCDRAATHGLLVQIEFWPGSGLDLATAAAVVAAADRPGGGLLVDTWHLARTAGGDALLRTIPGAYVTAVQVSDSPRVAGPEPDYLTATLERRLLPGDGALDLAGFVRGLDARACPATIGVEVWSAVLAAEPPVAVARRAGDAMRTILAAARAS